MGVKSSAISNIIKNENYDPRESTVVKYCDALGVKVETVYASDDNQADMQDVLQVEFEAFYNLLDRDQLNRAIGYMQRMLDEE